MQALVQWYVVISTFVLAENIVIDQYDSPLAANDYLLVAYRTEFKSDQGSIQYQCLSDNEKIFYVNFDSKPVYSVSIGKAQNQSQLYFVLAGIINRSTPYMSKITVSCNYNSKEMNKQETVFFQTQFFSHLAVAVDPHGRFSMSFTNTSFLFYDLINLQHFSIDILWPNSKIFLPLAIDIGNDFIYVVGYSTEEISDEDETTSFRTDVYLLTINSKHEIKFFDMWSNYELITEPLMKLAIKVAMNDEKVLVGLPTNDTVYLLAVNKTSTHLQYIGSKTRFQEGRFRKMGYGSNVGWLSDGRTAVILNIESFPGDSFLSIISTHVEYYDLNTNINFNDETANFSSFPNYEQTDEIFGNRKILFFVTTCSSSLYAMNDKEDILALLPSQPGFYSVEFLSRRIFDTQQHMFFLVPNSAQCPPGTYKNDSGIWPCKQCRVDTIDNSSLKQFNSSISITCLQYMEMIRIFTLKQDYH